MASQVKRQSAPIKVKKRKSPVEDSDDEDIPREAARKFFRPNATANTSEANSPTPEINYSKRTKPTIKGQETATQQQDNREAEQSKATKNHEEGEQDDGDPVICELDAEPDHILQECLPLTPPSPISPPSRRGVAIRKNCANPNAADGENKQRQNDHKQDEDQRHECLTRHVGLIIESHNNFIDTMRHVFTTLVKQPNMLCKTCCDKTRADS